MHQAKDARYMTCEMANDKNDGEDSACTMPHLCLSDPLMLPKRVCAGVIMLTMSLTMTNAAKSCLHCRMM